MGVLNQADIDALIGGYHRDPFSVLGMHVRDGDGLQVTTFLPGALRVQVLDATSGDALATLKHVHPDGVFSGPVLNRSKAFDYRFSVRWLHAPQERAQILADSYAYGALITEVELQALARGDHPQPYTVLGAHILSVANVAGVRFSVWAPNASRVSVVGDFNQWDGRRHAMRFRHTAGVWEIFVPHAAEGDLYKFEILGPLGNLLPLKADPYARAAQLRPDTASRVAAIPAPCALPVERAAANSCNAPISIYEVHVASWRRGSGEFLSWDELAQTLPKYAQSMGFTHIELLPVSEFPFDGSWGYQTLGLYALSARFGTVEGFGRFVRACHARGLGVLLDWVPAHFPSDAHGLVAFDGTALFEYPDPREGFHKDWNTLIYNFGRNEVRNFLAGNALYWMERHGVDGLRVDAVASMLYRDYSRKHGEWIPNSHGGRENLEAVSLMQRINEAAAARVPGGITVAEESTSWQGVSRPTSTGGLGFSYKWNMGWMNDTLRYMQQDPVHRRYHHDKMTFGLVYAFSENFVLPISHDEVVHGKGSMLGKMPGDNWQRFANLRAYYGFMWGHPGKKLLFMGQEFAQPEEWNHQQVLPWHLLDSAPHQGVANLIRDLNALYRSHGALHQHDCKAQGFEWLVLDDADQSVFVWLRRGEAGSVVLVACNFTPVPRHGYRIGVPYASRLWREALNTDSAHYGGNNLGNGAEKISAQAIAAHGHTHSIALTLPPLATVFLVAE